jgi:hypothetical protein
MKICESLFWLAILNGWLLIAPSALAQVDGINTFATTSCNGHQVDIHVTFNVYDTVSENITGWVVEREVVGNCVENVDVTEVMPLPTEIGDYEYFVEDNLTVPGKAIYYVFGVDAAGSRYWIGWGQRTMFAQADCYQGVAARGTVVDMPGGYPHLEVCPDECWWGLSYFDNSFPMDQELPPIGAVIDIYGEIISGMEGPYIDADLWVYSSIGCTSVGTDELTWGALKAYYR